MRIVHISDLHNIGHKKLIIPECDLLLCSGDLGGRTNIMELTEFLIWFEAQPAKKKIFCGGNHDIILDRRVGIHGQFEEALALIANYDVKYLENTDYIYEGFKIYGSPITPSFHRANGWAFNRDRGPEIQKEWSKIPSDVDILITHGPPYGILDEIPEKFKETEDEDVHRGDHDLSFVIKKRLLKLKLVCFGHIHDQVGVVLKSVSNTRRILFSNGAVLTNDYTQLITNPLIITL